MNKDLPKNDSLSESRERIMQQLESLATMLVESGHSCKSIGLFDGKMGMVIFLFHYARQTLDNRFSNMAEMLIDEIQSTIHADSPIDYAFGLTGIGVGIEYLAQYGFINIETDDILEDFDQIFIKQIHERKLYLSYIDLIDFKRFFSLRMKNPRTKKNDLFQQAIRAITTLLKLHQKVSACHERQRIFISYSGDTIWGLPEGYAGRGLSLLSALDSQHDTWLTLK
jgi:hypothetical protein